MIHRICPLKRNLGFGLGPRLDPLPCREKLFAASSSPPSPTSISYRHSTIQTEDGRGCPALSSCIENNVSITSASNAGSMSAASGGGASGATSSSLSCMAALTYRIRPTGRGTSRTGLSRSCSPTVMCVASLSTLSNSGISPPRHGAVDGGASETASVPGLTAPSAPRSQGFLQYTALFCLKPMSRRKLTGVEQFAVSFFDPSFW
jgi:hypothetical protein